MTTHASSFDRQSMKPGCWRTEFERIYSAARYQRARRGSGLEPGSRLMNKIASIFDTLQEWHQRRRSRWVLLSLDEYMRRDVGLSDADIWQEASKPFWRR